MKKIRVKLVLKIKLNKKYMIDKCETQLIDDDDELVKYKNILYIIIEEVRLSHVENKI